MYEYTIGDFSDLIVNKLEEIEKEVVLQNPDADSVFPCTVIRTPMENILNREGNMVIRKRFSISIEEWCESQRDCMEELYKTENKLRTLNILKTSNDISLKDAITNKYRIINTYETIYNALTNTFELIR